MDTQHLATLCAYLRSCFGSATSISFMDATSLQACHNHRINLHKVFKNLAARGNTSVDWFFGFKLHLIVNHKGELLNFTLTPGNTDDRPPVLNCCNGCSAKCLQTRVLSKGIKTVGEDDGCTVDYQATPQHEELFNQLE